MFAGKNAKKKQFCLNPLGQYEFLLPLHQTEKGTDTIKIIAYGSYLIDTH